MRERIGILGGTFNPVHIGHLRVALESSELLATDHFLLLPAALPPHRSHCGILPFGLRCELLEAALKTLPHLQICRIEGERQEPSYTWDTLGLLQKVYRGALLFFVLGCEDFSRLPFWRHGLDLPFRAHLCVVQRGSMAMDVFLASAKKFWPNAHTGPPLPGAEQTLIIPGPKGQAGYASYLDIPFLSVRATPVREHWLHGKNIRLLLPDAALALLEDRRPEIEAVWKQNTESSVFQNVQPSSMEK
jgi:nicotinate-nucleotide adenylyltransferase